MISDEAKNYFNRLSQAFKNNEVSLIEGKDYDKNHASGFIICITEDYDSGYEEDPVGKRLIPVAFMYESPSEGMDSCETLIDGEDYK